MYTKYDFPEIFRKKLYQKASDLIAEKTTILEKEILEQFNLLTELTSINWIPKGKYRKIGIFIGAAEGMDNVHEAYFLAKEIQGKFSHLNVKFITSGAIGVTLGKSKELGVPGVNGRVMTQLLYEYGSKTQEVITEDRSLHTDMQSTQMSKIVDKEKFDSIIFVTDYWHQARLMLTMIGRNPEINWFTHTVNIDKDNINSALFDWGQEVFQTPLLIAEVARIHEYVEKKMGPCDLDGLCENFLNIHPTKIKDFIRSRKLSRLKYLWDKTHEEIINNFDKFAKYR